MRTSELVTDNHARKWVLSSAVERLPYKQRAGGSIPSAPTITLHGAIAQLGERLPCKQEVVGSIPTGSTKTTPCSAVGSAPALGAGCRRFEPVHGDHYRQRRQKLRGRPHHCGDPKFGEAQAVALDAVSTIAGATRDARLGTRREAREEVERPDATR